MWCSGSLTMGLGRRRAAEAEIGQRGSVGEEPPEIDEEQPYAGDDGFLFAHRTAVALPDDATPFGKAVPARFPPQQAPDRFGEQTAQATVALPIDAPPAVARRPCFARWARSR